MFKIDRILVPVDFSERSTLALDWALTIVRQQPGTVLYLFHVLTPIRDAAAIPFLWDGVLNQEKEVARQRMDDLRAKIPDHILSFPVFGCGDVAEEIAKECEQRKIDLVIMTTHGRHGLSRLLHGSTTEATLRLAPCPVFVLHMNQAAVAKVLDPISPGGDTCLL